MRGDDCIAKIRRRGKSGELRGEGNGLLSHLRTDNRRGSMAGGSGYVSRNAHDVRALPMRPTGTPAMEPRLLLNDSRKSPTGYHDLGFLHGYFDHRASCAGGASDASVAHKCMEP